MNRNSYTLKFPAVLNSSPKALLQTDAAGQKSNGVLAP